MHSSVINDESNDGLGKSETNNDCEESPSAIAAAAVLCSHFSRKS